MSFSLSGLPVGLEMDFSGSLTLVLNIEPLLPVFLASEGSQLGLTFANLLIFAWIIVQSLKLKVVSEVFDVDGEGSTVPFGFLAALFDGFRLPFEVAGLEVNVGIHLADSSVARKVRLNQRDCECAKR